MGDINLSLIIPVWIVAGLLLASVEYGERETQAEAKDVYPDSRHREALRTVEGRTAPAFSDWQSWPTGAQAAWDEHAIATDADRTPPPGKPEPSQVSAGGGTP